ncbi:MAG: hypothetical protein ACI4WG_06620 [Erysipelotrichaceae bacterium]
MKQYFQPIYWLKSAQKLYELQPKWIKELSLFSKFSHYLLCERFLTDSLYRTEVLLYPVFAVNLFYSVMQFLVGLFNHSIWSNCLAVYYGMLAFLRLQLLKGLPNGNKDVGLTQWSRYFSCGMVLLFMTPLFASVLILVVHKNSFSHYPAIVILIMELYTLCLVISAIINLVKLRKQLFPVLAAAKLVGLTATLMSVLSLTTALVGKLDEQISYRLKQGLVGTVAGIVCVLVLSISVYMVVNSHKQIKTKKLN